MSVYTTQSKIITHLRAENAKLRDMLIDALTAERDAARAACAALRGDARPWPLRDVLQALRMAVMHLRDVHSCDTDGHERFSTAASEAKYFEGLLESTDSGKDYVPREMVKELVDALKSILDLCQITGLSFEAQSFKATEIALGAIRAAKEAGVDVTKQEKKILLEYRLCHAQ
jgi:hypothetical protein